MKFLTLNDGTWSKTKILAILTAGTGLAMALGVKLPDWLSGEQLGGLAAMVAALLHLFQRDATDKGASA